MNYLKNFNYKKHIAEIFFAIAIIALVIIIPASSNVYATQEFWAVNVGDKAVVYLNSESEANKVIKQVKEKYTDEGATDVAISCDPEMTVVHESFKEGEYPKTSEVRDAVEYIITGTEEPTEYTIKSGDTLWTISEEHDITLEELEGMNKGLTEDTLIKPGDKLNLFTTKPFVTVKTTETVTRTEKIEHRVKYVKKSSMAKGTTKVKKKGVDGKRKVTSTIVMENGVEVKSVVKSSKVLKRSVTEIVYKGTKETASSSSSSSNYSGGSVVGSGSGAAIAAYACRFVGNPYVYGGSSLTNGADCSGFVMAVYKHFGISLPHGAVYMRSYGRGVSLSQAKPGDIICYGGHVSIYIGGGREVHAINYAYGIGITPVGFSRTGLVCVRRLVE